MIKSASLISAALLVFGLAAGSCMAQSAPTGASAAAPTTDAPKAHKHKTAHSKKAKKKKTTPAAN